MQLVELFKAYFEGEVNENSLRSNFVLVYELLDEVMDYGYPQLTDPTVLKNLIMQKGFKSELAEFAMEMVKQKVRSCWVWVMLKPTWH